MNSSWLPSELRIKPARFSDLRDALFLGLSDFKMAPLYGLAFGGVYAVGGIFIVWLAFERGNSWAIYPLVIGFALLGPFFAVGLYEVSRRMKTNEPLSWAQIMFVIFHQRNREFGWMAFVTLFFFWIWMYQVRTLVAVFFGSKGFVSFDDLLTVVLTTQTGMYFLIAGNLVGAILSLSLFALTVISCPLLLDREVDIVTAMVTSVRTVLASPLVMISWGICIVLCVLLSALTGFLGLLVIFPLFGHATWHLYKQLLVPIAVD